MIRKYQIYIILFLFTANYLAQNNELQFEHITTENGLSNNIVTGIVQDKQGFMWFGTNSGLNRWDGNKFKTFTHDPKDSNSLSNDGIFTLYLDSKDNMWIGTAHGLNKFDWQTEKFKRYFTNDVSLDDILQNAIMQIEEDHNNIIWYCTQYGLCKLDVSTSKITRFLPEPGNYSSTLNPNYINSFCENEANQLLLGSSGGLICFDTKTNIFIKISFNDLELDRWPAIHKIYKDRKKKIWLGMAGYGFGLLQYDLPSRTFIRYKPDDENQYSISHYNIIAIHEDHKGALWIGTNSGGLNRYFRDTEYFFSYQHSSKNPWSIGSSNINSIYSDINNNLWIGTSDRGVSYIPRWRNSFKHYVHDTEDVTSIGAGEVTSICESRNGDLWVTQWGGEVSRMRKNENNFIHYSRNSANGIKISNEWVSEIIEDKYGYIWAASMGLDRIDIKTNTVVHYEYDAEKENSPGGMRVMSIYQDKKGIMWLGIWNGGVDKFDPELGTFQHFRNDRSDQYSISNNNVQSVLHDSKNTLWIGTTNGLNKLINLENGKLGFIRYKNDISNPNSISSNNVYALYEDSNNRIWVGTGSGLNLYDRENDNFICYTQYDELTRTPILAILEDYNSNLWLRTNSGIVKFNHKIKFFKTYTQKDGFLDSWTINQGYKAFYKDRSGKFYLGGQNSLTIFHPDSLKKNPHQPNIVLTDFRIKNISVKIGDNSYLNKSITFAELLELPHYESTFSFEFAALDYTGPNKNQYAYKLHGFNEEWIYTNSDNRIASYTNIDPGEYIFRVKGSNNDGIWNEEGASVKVIILPPWWATWWFRLIASIFLVSLGYLIYRYRVKQLLKLERMRVQIASDLHDDVGSSLTKIAIHSEIIQNTDDKNKVTSSSAKIGSMSREIITSLSDIIWSIDARNDKVGDLIDRMRDYLDTVFAAGSITTNFQTKGLVFENNITQELRQNIYLIFKEAINNAAKHSDATEVKISMTNGTGKFKLEISDNGKGIELNDKGSHSHGLQNMKLRSEKMGGQLEIENRNGTKIILIVKEL